MKKILVAFFILIFSRNFLGATHQFWAGAAEITITPTVETFSDSNKNNRYDAGEPFEDLNKNGKWDPVWLAGYRGGRYATGKQGDIWAKALVLKTKDASVVFVALDLIGFMFDEADKLKESASAKFGIPKNHVFIASTHDHSGPDTLGIWGDNGQSGKDPAYLEWLRTRVMGCVTEAMDKQKPAKVIFAKMHYPNPIDDPRPPRVINDLLMSFRAVDAEGKTIGTVVNYAMHAEVLNENNHLITPDYPGTLRQVLEQHFGGIALFFAADIGGMQTPKVIFHTFRKARKLGKALARKVIQSYKNQQPVEIDQLSVKTQSILFPIQNPRFAGEIQKGLFGETANLIQKQNDQIFLPAEAGVIRLGPAMIATVPGEAFPELGHKIRDKMNAEYKFMIGLCNNEIGYIVPKEQWHWDWYEESMSLGPETEPILLDAFDKLLAK